MDGWHGARHWGAPAVGAGLAVVELALVRLAGPPGRQLEVLRRIAEVGAEPLASPLASLLALLALAAEGLAAYLLAVLGLRLLAMVPGAAGRLDDIPAIRTPSRRRRCRPGKVDADKGYDSAANCGYLRRRGITARIGRRGIESSTWLGRHGWKVERALSGCPAIGA